MNSHAYQPERSHDASPLFNYTNNIGKITLAAITTCMLSGCLLISPFWNQEFTSHTNTIPLQAFTTHSSSNIHFQCAKASHGGLHPYGSEPSWTTVANISPSADGSYDPAGGRIYSAGTSTVLPANCWRQDPANAVWYTAIRAQQVSGSTTTLYKTFTKPGLECLGREIGKMANWLGWIGKGCTVTYLNSNTDIPYTIIRAQS